MRTKDEREVVLTAGTAREDAVLRRLMKQDGKPALERFREHSRKCRVGSRQKKILLFFTR